MIAPAAEKRVLQVLVALACAVPLSAGLAGIVQGPAFVGGASTIDLDSHFRYLSGLLLAIGLGFASCVPDIERKGGRMRLLAAIVVVGGIARGWSLANLGMPSTGHLFGLAMELGVVPALTFWQAGMARRHASIAHASQERR